MFRGRKDRAPAPPPPAPPLTGTGAASATNPSADPIRAMRREQDRTVRHAHRDYERELTKLRQEEIRSKDEIRRLVAAGRQADAAQVAKSLAQNRKFQDQALRGKTQATSVGYQASQALSQAKMMGVMHDTTQMMSQANAASNPQGMMRTMQDYEMEKDKMEMAQEMTNDVMESAFGGAEIDAEADNILNEVLAQAGLEVRNQLAVAPQIHPVPRAQPQQEQTLDAERAEFERRFAGLGP